MSISLGRIGMHTVSNELKELARLVADWAAPAPSVRVYLFGSRVRGDHKSTSDVDVCFKWGDQRLVDTDALWWTTNNQEDFAAIKSKLPGPLKILPKQDLWWEHVVAAEMVYQDHNVCCVWLPPKP